MRPARAASGTECAGGPCYAWGFYMDDGRQGASSKDFDGSALAVRPGQISAAPVPEPATMLLMGTGLAGLLGLRQRRRGC